MPPCTVIPQLVYDDVGQAVEWLCDKFGFSERWHARDHRAQVSFGGARSRSPNRGPRGRCRGANP
jgi:uncharacterized glyoxalase superfamily protein PhnB